MEERLTNLAALAVKHGASNAAVVHVDGIQFKREFREACERNLCGHYGTCWMCPPDVGDIDALIAKAKSYRHALVFQHIGQLEDSFDIEGMQEAAKQHNALTRTLTAELASLLPSPLILGAGACQLCDRCAKRDGEPCRHPEDAIPSLEAHGIAVSELAKLCGMNYINGQDTVTYFGGFFFD